MNQKQVTAIALVSAFAFSLTACGKPAPAAAPSQGAAASVSQSVSTAAPAAQSTVLPQDTADGANAMQKITPPYEDKLAAAELPAFLPQDLQQLYNAAFFLTRSLMMTSGFQIDFEAEPLTMDDGMQYYPDSGFSSYSAFRAALDAAFTEDFANQLLNESRAYVDDGNDKLYSLGGARGSNIFYKGCDFALTSVTDKEILITMTGNYAKEMDAEGNWSEEETTEDFVLRLVKTETGWRFAEFALAF